MLSSGKTALLFFIKNSFNKNDINNCGKAWKTETISKVKSDSQSKIIVAGSLQTIIAKQKIWNFICYVLKR